jgi:hypothetical protein
MDLCSRPEFRVQFMHVKCSLGTTYSECNSCEVFASHPPDFGMLAPSLKNVNPQSLIFFELRHFEPLQTRVYHSQMISRMATWHIVVPFIEKGTLISSGTYLESDYVPPSVSR